MKFAAMATPLEEDEPEVLGDPWMIVGHDGSLTIGFEYSRRSVRLVVDEDATDEGFVKAWGEATDRKLRDVIPVYPYGYKDYGKLMSAGEFNAEGMYVEATDDWSQHLCVIACPSCGKDGKPLVRKDSYYVGGGMRWVGLDYQEPHSDYRTRCPRCHTEFKFTIYTPQ